MLNALGWAKRAGVAATAAVLLVGLVAGPTAANHDLYRRVSAGAGTRGNGAFSATFKAVSADGKRAFFESAERLVLADTDSSVDVYERSGGTTKRISSGAINGNGALGATLAGISIDGSRAFFRTSEQLVAADTDSVDDIYERSAGVTTLVSAGAINGNGLISALFAGISTDGTKAFFTSAESLVATDTDDDTDVYERSGGTTKLVSAGQINGNLDFDVSFSGTSANGARVWFVTQEKLVNPDTDNQPDVYERSSGLTFQVSRGTINGNGAFASVFAGASSDGSRVFYTTTEPLDAADTDAFIDVYQFSAGAVTLISAGAINGNGPNHVTFRAASTDGTRVFFSTDERLVAADADSSTDIYQRVGGVTSRVSAGVINGNGNTPSLFDAVSVDGLRVFFHTSESLVAADTDASTDQYEFSTGTTKLVSAGAINGNGGFSTSFGGISADGTRVFFQTAEQLSSDDDDATLDVYERAAGQTLLVTIGAADTDALFRRCSSDGLAVFFETTEKLLASDKDAATDVYGAYDAF